MNILIDQLSTILKDRIGNIEFNTDFRTSILFEMMMMDRKISKEDKVANAILLYYPNPKEIKDISKAIDDILWFYSCRRIEDLNSTENKKKSKNRSGKNTNIYDYEYDDGYIYSAFLQQYGIDLQDIDYLHWWKFKAMFNSLSSDTKIVEIMEYRSIDLGQIQDKKEKAKYKKLKEIYRLPDMRTEEEKENDFGSSLW